MSRTSEQWLEYLESLHPSDIELGLARISAVAEQLHCLKPAPLVILVAGTNGKGTTSALLAALLKDQGMRVGVYSSPHIRRYHERVMIDGEMISDADLIRSFEQVESVRGETALTYFEFGTLAALWHFQQHNLDACVLEIGLGGRLDAVNIVDADIAVVTSIGLDHQSWLGETLDDIAFEKCGIARSGKYLVCGQANPPKAAKTQTESLGGHWCTRGQHFDIVETAAGLEISFMSPSGQQEWHAPSAHIPYHNVATAIQTLALLNQLPSQALVSDTVRSLCVPGRLQSIRLGEHNTRLTLDVAHNPQAAAYLTTRLPRVDGIVLAMLADKEVEAVVAALPAAPVYHLCSLDVLRGLSARQLQTRLAGNLDADIHLFSSVADGLDSISNNQHWLVAGSFYTVEAALQKTQPTVACERSEQG